MTARSVSHLRCASDETTSRRSRCHARVGAALNSSPSRMSMSETPLLASPLTRRALFGRAAGAATTLVVSQTLMGCGTAGAALATDTGVGGGACVLTTALTEGPYFIDQKLNRSDIRTDPVTGIISTGIPLALTFNVSGWYSGRAVQTHFKLRLCAGATKTYEFTSQFFFPESLSSTVHAQSPYSSRGIRNTRNDTDGIYNGLTTAAKSALTLATMASHGEPWRVAVATRASSTSSCRSVSPPCLLQAATASRISRRLPSLGVVGAPDGASHGRANSRARG